MRHGGQVRIDGLLPATAGFTGAESAVAYDRGLVSKIIGSLEYGRCYCAFAASIASAAVGEPGRVSTTALSASGFRLRSASLVTA